MIAVIPRTARLGLPSADSAIPQGPYGSALPVVMPAELRQSAASLERRRTFLALIHYSAKDSLLRHIGVVTVR